MTSRSSIILTTVALGATAWIALDQIQRRRRKVSSRGIPPPVNQHVDDSSTAQEEQKEENADAPPPPLREILRHADDDNCASIAEDGKRKDARRILDRGTVTVVHGSITGTCRTFALELGRTLGEMLEKKDGHVQVASTQDFDWWDELVNDDGEESDDANNDSRAAVTNKADLPALLILIVSTYSNGTWPPAAENLSASLQELLNDWRIAKFPLRKKLQVAVFGMGSSEYTVDDASAGSPPSNMGQPAKEALSMFQRLGARCVVPLRIGDDAVGNHARQSFDSWSAALVKWFKATAPASREAPGASDSCCHGNKSNGDCCQVRNESNGCQDEKGASAATNDGGDEDGTDSESDDEEGEPEVMDLEDMGDAMMASQDSSGPSAAPREMVTPSQAKALKKEGYRLIGTHSAVKLCRWTKHQLRGRGGCYKHTFYGITSYQCMEATPSLACANKCVFCWRHHKNPVGKEWRWKTDDPHYIVDQAVRTHVQMIKEARGIPGVQLDRWREAHTVRHCALSLVGEPIMYPRIDELLADLHNRKISTFLVTNGQHPSAIASLRPITQLYVSVDAPSKESLIAIDRPLFSDAWERLRESLSSLRDKGQRTVARLTVVKGWNSDELEGYAQLIALGHVSLVEVKGVTFCGKSDASNLNMTNTPWHHEVVELTQTLKREIDKLRRERLATGVIDIPPEYDIACEHRHSCSVLLARVDQFAVADLVSGQRKWRTWIDYDKFHELAARHAHDPTFAFTVQDYTAETPSWALFGSDEEGFDPTDTRHRRKSKHPMYTQFDERGVPTHDHNNQVLDDAERYRLGRLMDERRAQIGSGSVVTEFRDGAKEVLDASLMFRGLVIVK